ncbi:MAG: CDP-diacylglycerol--serine O-phosphatidyltransferase [Bacteroidota bacterium]
MRKNIANYITCLNLLCGCVAIYYLYRGDFITGVFLILAAAVFDFADGFVARLLHVKSPIGLQLDSLADVVSFGVAPGVAMFQLITFGMHVWNFNLPSYTPFIAFIIPVFSAWRLAKFNIDERQTDHFIGLPTPANALVIMSFLPLVARKFQSPLFPFNDYVFYFITNPLVLIAAAITLSYLLVSNLPLFAMKFKTFGWRTNKIRYSFIIASVVLISLFYFVAIHFVIILYILLSLIDYLYISKHQKT